MKKPALVLIFIALIAFGCARRSQMAKNDVPDPKAAVIDASHKLTELKLLTGRIDAVSETPYKQQVEFIAPDKYHVWYHDDTGGELEMITSAGKTYLRSGDTWTDLDSETSITPTMRNSFTDDVLSSISDVQYEGDETLDDKQTRIFSYNLVTKVGNFHAKQRIWVDKDSGVPVKCFVEYSEGPIKTLTTTFDSQSPVTIEAPPPAAK
ncbi:MAG TPA: hypothetical protein VGC97_02795 [Pyrinomonadaceae bacterium]|jgi:outer membrane lipoprotein-sorting protein